MNQFCKITIIIYKIINMFSIDMTNCTRKLYGGVIRQLPRHILNNGKIPLKVTRQNVALNQEFTPKRPMKPMVANVRQINNSPSYSMVQNNQSIIRRPMKPMVANVRQINNSPGYSFVYSQGVAGGKYRKSRKYYTHRKRRN